MVLASLHPLLPHVLIIVAANGTLTTTVDGTPFPAPDETAWTRCTTRARPGAGLLGPFLSTHLPTHRDPAAVRDLLDAALTGLTQGRVGSVSEPFDGDPPHLPRAASAQAWGVAELLRVWRQLDG
ncbi:Amylo-alpha-1,6-glucosidase [Tessaracoccus bendigoensis DSM 12906]|uniref:Amylo-alpha-1,6-glucosidase n=1 Tax=Tessaracoccus bendigoensis DSM 12906 TaxID=1123357 RepID=A0A1M6BIW2_9ACTN|nr:amylo-alpha-1,6-glucosidase [Tessaracoccus bendigoensis]SHI48587.1 Amylo-alpha-1,6-glucosidase [Tessaracoccus bendigoensis DSM 12906]